MKFNPPKIKVLGPKQRMIDTDRDGVPDYKDCRPLNPRMQHVKPNILMAKRIKALPLYVSSSKKGERYHVLSKKAKQVPKARGQLLSALKKYPSLVGDIEKAPEPKEYVHRHARRSHLPGRLKIMYEKPFVSSEVREDTIERMSKEEYELHIQRKEEELQDTREVWGTPKNRFSITDLPEDIEFGEMLEKKAYYKQQPFSMEEIRPSSYRGPYTGTRQSSVYTKVITKGDNVHDVLWMLNKQKSGSSHWSQLKYQFSFADMQLGQVLHKMENTGLITHPSRGLYKITSLGKNILEYVDEKGKWRYKDTVVPRGVMKGWPDTDQEQRIKMVSQYYDRGRVPYQIMNAIQHRGIARWGEIQEITGFQEQNFSQTLRRMEQTGLITRPRPGEYKLTAKGKNVLKKVEEEGIWRL